MNLEKLNLKIKKTFPNENLTVMEYSNMKSYFVIKCNNCNKVYEFQRAENFFKRKNGCSNCSETEEWKKQKENFLLWLKDHKEFELVDDLNNIHKSQEHIKCKCTICGRIQENKTIYDYYNNKKCFCQTKSIKKPKDQIEKDFKDICIFLEEYINTDTPILVKSLFCGHQFKVAPRDILRKPYLCPICNSSYGEKKILFWLEENGISYYRQFKVENYRIDFYLPEKNIAIEFNGIQHYEPVKHFGGEERFKQQQLRDNYIRNYCKAKGIKLIEISYLDYEKVEEILQQEVD